MTRQIEDWEKRERSEHLSESEIHEIRRRNREGELPRNIARDLRCSTRIVHKYIAQFEGRINRHRYENRARRDGPRVTEQKPRQTEAERREARHYRGSFEI